MPLRDDLLTPIAGESPAGPSLRYDRVYDQIKEARTEEDESLPSGDWARKAKRADFRLAAKLAGEALALRSKDLQLAVWLGEALFKLEGFSALGPSLRLFLELQENFWDTLHPEIDDGDAGLRAVPLQWAASRYASLLQTAPLTADGVSYADYKRARAIGTGEEIGDNPQRRAAREQAIADGKPTIEEVRDRIAATPKAFYKSLDAHLSAAEQALESLQSFCEDRYGDDAPSFRKLREALEEIHNVVRMILEEKLRIDPDPEEKAPAAPEAPPAVVEPVLEEVNTAVSQVQNAAPPSPAQVPAQPVAEPLPQMAQPGPVTPARSSEPESEADALHRIEAGISYIGAQSPESPLPFALRSAMRLAELRQIVLRSEMERLEAPPTELRQSLKRALAEGDWRRLHQASLAAMGQPCGCGWLDLYRYLWTSCRELGWQAQQFSIAAALQQCLREFPELPGWSLNDDTPAANHETAAWIAAEINPPVSKPESPAESAEPFLESSVPSQPETASVAEDAFAAARAMAARGDIHGAIQSLAADAAQQTIGRLRYQRNLQIAALCVEHAKCTVAVPLLQGLVREVEDRRLESWESVDLAARPYALLLQCGSAAKVDTASVFARLCSIDPGAALTIAPGLRD